MEAVSQRRISDVSFTIDRELNVSEGNLSFLRLFNVTDPHLNLRNFMSESDSDNFNCFLNNLGADSSNPHFVACLEPCKNQEDSSDTPKQRVKRNCLFSVEKRGELFYVDVKELSYSKQLLDKALLESREYTALLQNFDAYYFLYDGEKFTLKNTKDSVSIFEGNFFEFEKYFTNNFKLDMIPEDSRLQFNAMISDSRDFIANKIYKFLKTDKNLLTVRTVKTSTRNNSIIVGSINTGEEENLTQNVYSEKKDGLTDLYNKKAITELAIQKINDSKNPVTLIIMDVDKFKECNDTYGHAFGDKVLVAVSSCIKEAINGIGIAGRIGGDEFLLIIDKTDEADIRNVTRNIRVGIQWSITATDPSSIVTCSMGIARSPANAKTYEDLFKIADKCLYIAKSKGRNCYIIYKPELHDTVMINNEKNASAVVTEEYLQNSADSEEKIINEISMLNRENSSEKINDIIEMLLEYMQVNKITVYDKDFSPVYEFEKLTQKSHKPHGDIRRILLENPKDYFKYFNDKGFFHLDNTNVLETIDQDKHGMYRNSEISSIIEIKYENCFFCFDIYKPARTFAKEKLIFSLLATKMLSKFI